MKINVHDGATQRCTLPQKSCACRRVAILNGPLVSSIALAAGLFAGAAGMTATAAAASAKPSNPPAGPVTFAVLSDTHLYSTKLGTTGSKFETYLYTDPKLLEMSEAILDATLAEIIKSKVHFVIISGDLTKDGEILNHVLMTQYLQKVEQAGIEVYVVPGNHDINNADAVEFRGDKTKPVPNASPEVFKALYQRFGYGQALDHAPDSLSYVAEAAPGLWLLALDSAKWAESETAGTPIVSGRISSATMTWAQAKMDQAKKAGMKVIAFMHHGVNPHFVAQPLIFGDYLVDNWWDAGPKLDQKGLRAIFTGHYHSQDAAAWTYNFPAWLANRQVPPDLQWLRLCDIQTGSLVSYPCKYRVATLDVSGQLTVKSEYVKLGGIPVAGYAYGFAIQYLPYAIMVQLSGLGYTASGPDDQIVQFVMLSLLANFGGDEAMNPLVRAILDDLYSLGGSAAALASMIETLWVDLPPGDNTVTVNLNN